MNKELKGRLHCSLRFIFLDKIMQRIVYYFITNEVFLNFINHFSRTFSLTLLHSFFPYTRGFSAGRDGQRLPGLSAERSFQSLPWKAMLRQVEHFIIQSQWSTVFSTQFIYSCAIPIVARFFSGLYFFFSSYTESTGSLRRGQWKSRAFKAAIISQSLHLPGRPTAKPRTLLEASKELPLEPLAKAEQAVGVTPKDLVPPSCNFVPLFLRISWSPHGKPSQFSAG